MHCTRRSEFERHVLLRRSVTRCGASTARSSSLYIVLPACRCSASPACVKALVVADCAAARCLPLWRLQRSTQCCLQGVTRHCHRSACALPPVYLAVQCVCRVLLRYSALLRCADASARALSVPLPADCSPVPARAAAAPAHQAGCATVDAMCG
jgi:hypothetical protein